MERRFSAGCTAARHLVVLTPNPDHKLKEAIRKMRPSLKAEPVKHLNVFGTQSTPLGGFSIILISLPSGRSEDLVWCDRKRAISFVVYHIQLICQAFYVCHCSQGLEQWFCFPTPLFFSQFSHSIRLKKSYGFPSQ